MEPAVLRSDWELALQEIEALKSEAEILAYQEVCSRYAIHLLVWSNNGSLEMSEEGR